MRALFDYEPEEDTLLPCKEIGLPFKYGDILQVSWDTFGLRMILQSLSMLTNFKFFPRLSMWKIRIGGKPNTSVKMSWLVWFHRKSWRRGEKHSYHLKLISYTRSVFAELKWVCIWILVCLDSNIWCFYLYSLRRFQRRSWRNCTKPRRMPNMTKPIWLCMKK